MRDLGSELAAEGVGTPAGGRRWLGWTRIDRGSTQVERGDPPGGRRTRPSNVVAASSRGRFVGPRTRRSCGQQDRPSSGSSRHQPLRSTPLARPAQRAVRRAAVATVPGTPEEESVARPGQRQTGARRTAPRNQRRGPPPDGDVISVLARAVREVEAAAQRGRVTACRAHEVPGRRPAAARGARPGPGGGRQRQPVGPSSSSAWTASRPSSRRPPSGTPGLLALLAEDAVVSDAARSLQAGDAAGRRHRAERPRRSPPAEPAAASAAAERRGRAAVGGLPAAGQPLPRPRLLAPARRPRPRRAAWPAGSCSARSSARSSAPAAEPRRAWRCRRRPPLHAPGGPGADAAPGAAGRRGRGRPPDLPARRRAGPGQDGPGAARRGGGERLPAARGRAERRQDQLGPRGRPAGRRTARPP